MDMSLQPSAIPPLLAFPTIQLMVTLTFLIQALVIAIHSRLVRRYPGIRMYLASVLVLAADSFLLLVQPLLPFGLVGIGSSLLLLWGMALQYVALVRFTGAHSAKGWFWFLVCGGSVFLMAFGQIPGWTPFVAVREALTVPLLFAVPLLLRRADVTGYQLGAILTALPFAGYGILSAIRVIRGLLDPSLMQPGPSLRNDVDALLFFVCSFFWTSGFLLMLNQRLHSDLRTLATRDPQTDCLNRRAMGKLLDEEKSRLERYDRPFAVILLDLDRFKAINDTLGHGAGDRVLVEISAVLRKTLRVEDSLARWGGEEFLILLPETGKAEGTALAERLRLRVEEHDFFVPGFRVSFSAGVAGAQTGQSVDELVSRADKALYKAKETRNTVVTAD
jgi:diguanylate cyclase (GGDEF)-like protein